MAINGLPTQPATLNAFGGLKPSANALEFGRTGTISSSVLQNSTPIVPKEPIRSDLGVVPFNPATDKAFLNQSLGTMFVFYPELKYASAIKDGQEHLVTVDDEGKPEGPSVFAAFAGAV